MVSIVELRRLAAGLSWAAAARPGEGACGAAVPRAAACAQHVGFLAALARQLAVAALLEPGRQAADDHADAEREEQEEEQRQLRSSAPDCRD